MKTVLKKIGDINLLDGAMSDPINFRTYDILYEANFGDKIKEEIKKLTMLTAKILSMRIPGGFTTTT